MERWIRGELSSPLTWSGRFTVGQTIVLSHRIILAFCEKVLIVSFFFFLLSFFFLRSSHFVYAQTRTWLR
jgi:hypothetical protein